MSILKISKIGHPILLKECSEIKEFSSDSLKKIVYDMSETMLDYNGIGLAAPQVHISKQILVFRNPDIEEKDKIEITPLIILVLHLWEKKLRMIGKDVYPFLVCKVWLEDLKKLNILDLILMVK